MYYINYIYIYIYLETSENLIVAFKKILSGNVWVEPISKNLKGVWFNLSPLFSGRNPLDPLFVKLNTDGSTVDVNYG